MVSRAVVKMSKPGLNLLSMGILCIKNYIAPVLVLLAAIFLNGCIFESRLTKAANNNRLGLLKDKPCPECPSMGVIQISNDAQGKVKISELCDRITGLETNIPLVDAKITMITKARISKLEYHECVSAGMCSGEHVRIDIDMVEAPSELPVLARLPGAREYKLFLSEKLGLNCRYLRRGERIALQNLKHSPTPPCKGRSCISNDYNEVYALNERSADIGSYPTRTKCNMLDLQAVSYDLEIRESITNTNPKMAYNLRLICTGTLKKQIIFKGNADE